MTIRVLGYVMAKNEWPLLGLAVVHALNCDIDHVVVVNHASSDETSIGLQRLKLMWPNRITIIDLKMQSFLQEETVAVVLSSINAHEYDWVYIFDADEFILFPQKTSFVELLEAIPKSVGAIKYELDQWVAPHDMNDLEISSYKNIKKRSVPCIFINQSGELLATFLQKGYINYFDVPFSNKIIVRGPYAHLLTAGAHSIDTKLKLVVHKVNPSVLRVGHLPLISKRRLVNKADHGRCLIEEGYPPDHGWQNQALYKLELAGGLETFWQSHSIGALPEGDQANFLPNTVDDQSLTAVLEKAVDLFMEFNKPTEEEMNTKNIIDFSGLENIIMMIHNLQKDALVKDTLNQKLLKKLETIESSKSWRMTAPARYLSKKFRF